MCTNPCGSSSRASRLKMSTASASSTWCRKLLMRMKSKRPSPSPVYRHTSVVRNLRRYRRRRVREVRLIDVKAQIVCCFKIARVRAWAAADIEHVAGGPEIIVSQNRRKLLPRERQLPDAIGACAREDIRWRSHTLSTEPQTAPPSRCEGSATRAPFQVRDRSALKNAARD